MVGKHNQQKIIQSNLKQHYKAYKAGKHWIFASIAGLSMGSALFFGAGLTSFAQTDSSSVATTSSASTVSTDSSSTLASDTSSDSASTSEVTSSSDSGTSADATSTDDTATATTSADTASTDAATTSTTTDTTSTDTSSTKNSEDSTSDTASKSSDSATTQTKTTATSDANKDSQTTTTSDATSVQSTTQTDTDSSVESTETAPKTASVAATAATAVTDENSSLKITTLVDPTTTDLANAKATAAAEYALTSQPQEIRALAADPSDAKLTISTNVSSLGFGNTSGQFVASVGFSDVKAGDVVTITVPKLDVLRFQWSTIASLDSKTGTTTSTTNADGSLTITDTFTADVATLTQTITIGAALSSSVAVQSDPAPVATTGQFGQTITADITSTYNGAADATATVTQVSNPSITVSGMTRTQPSASTVTAVVPDTDYVYTVGLTENIGYGADTLVHRILAAMNAGGSTITIPVPTGFTLDETLTKNLNNFGATSKITITQASAGADVIITVPAGEGETNLNMPAPYYIAGSYDVAQTADTQTLTASGAATVTQNTPNGVMTATGDASSVWTETLQATDAKDTATATISGIGNTSGNKTVLVTGTSYDAIETMTVSTDATRDVTDGVITINIPDGINATGFVVPASNWSQTSGLVDLTNNYTPNTTSYGYTITYADGTTESGTVSVPSANSNGTVTGKNTNSAIRKIVLTPNYIAAGAGTYQFAITGSTAVTYDDGTAIEDGDKLTFTATVDFPTTGTSSSGSDTQTIQAGVGEAVYWRYQSSSTPGKGAGSYSGVRNTGNLNQTTDSIFEPIIYIVLPNHAPVKSVNIPAADLAAGVTITNYTTDTGQNAIKIDYSGTGLSVSTKNGSNIYTVVYDNIYQDAVAGQYPTYMYITSPVTTLQGTSAVTDLSMVDGDTNAVLVSDGRQTFTVVTANTTSNYSYAQGNKDDDAVANGQSDSKGSSEIYFYTNIVNGLATTAAGTSEIVNLPTIGDSNGSTYNFTLTGEVTLPNTFTTSDGTSGSLTGEVLYSTSLYTGTTGTTPDLSTYMTADELTAAGITWSQVRSVYLKIGSMPANTSTNRIQITGTAENFAAQAGKTGAISTYLFANGAKAYVTNNAASVAISGTATVKAQLHYVDDDGNDVYVPLTDLTKTYIENSDTMADTDFPTTATEFSSTDTALIPAGYTFVTNADGSLFRTITNSTVTDYDGLANALAAFGQTVAYYFDGDTVTYDLTDGKVLATVTYVDDDADGAVVNTAKIKGDPDSTGTYTVTVPVHYALAENQSNSVPYTLTADDSDNITIHLVHAHATETIPVSYTVNFTNEDVTAPDGTLITKGMPTSLLPNSYTTTMNWTMSTDEVTGTVTYIPDEASLIVKSPDIPTIAGYTTYQKLANGWGVANVIQFNNATSATAPTLTNIARLNYAGGLQTINAQLVDDETGTVVQEATRQAYTDSTFTWSLPTLPAGYEWASDQETSGTYTVTAADNPALTFHLIHATTTDPAAVTTTDTVTYTGLPSDKAQKDSVTTISWDKVTDDVTGAVTYQPTTTTATTVPTPDVAGYTADQATVTFDAPTTTSNVPTNQAQTVTYTANAATINVTYTDDVTGQTLTDLSTTLSGHVDETGTYTVTVPTGYALASGQSATVTYTFNAADSSTITVHLSHHLTRSTTTTSRTINYLLDGTTTALKLPTKQTLTWNVVTDNVTGTSYATAVGGYAAVAAPTITGYKATSTGVDASYPALTATADLADSTATIYYTADTTPDGGNTTNPDNGNGGTTTPDNGHGGTTTNPDNGNGNTTTPDGNSTDGDSTVTTPETTGDTTTTDSSGDAVTDTSASTSDSNETAAGSTAGSSDTATTASTSTDGSNISNDTRMARYHSATKLPQTSENENTAWSVMGLGLLSAMSALGLAKRKKHHN